MTIDELAAYLNVPKGTIYQWRHRRTAPPAIKISGNHVRWRPEDVECWLAEQASKGAA